MPAANSRIEINRFTTNAETKVRRLTHFDDTKKYEDGKERHCDCCRTAAEKNDLT